MTQGKHEQKAYPKLEHLVVSAEIIESNGNRKTRGEGLYQVMESEKSDNHNHTSSV